jgi:CBS domain-containing protein
MTADPSVCRADAHLQDVAKLMCDEDCGAIPVVDAQGKPLGIVTDRDIACRVVAKGRDALQTQARDCMTPDPGLREQPTPASTTSATCSSRARSGDS